MEKNLPGLKTFIFPNAVHRKLQQLYTSFIKIFCSFYTQELLLRMT